MSTNSDSYVSIFLAGMRKFGESGMLIKSLRCVNQCCVQHRDLDIGNRIMCVTERMREGGLCIFSWGYTVRGFN